VCTIITVSRDLYTRDVWRRIREDATRNNDGWSLLLTGPKGPTTLLRSMDFQQIEDALDGRWDRMFLHSRMATQGEPSVANAHGWVVDGVCVMHNGGLRAPEALKCDVDSQAICLWIRQGGMDYALKRLKSEFFANVFMIDMDSGIYVVHRSSIGSLYTDGYGNYSTNAIQASGNEREEIGMDRYLLPPRNEVG
jgi:hypothetical protein